MPPKCRAEAISRAFSAPAAFAARGDEIACHGLWWRSYQLIEPDVERIQQQMQRLGERLSHLARHRIRDLFLPLCHEVADATHHVATRRSRRTPSASGVATGGNAKFECCTGHGAVVVGEIDGTFRSALAELSVATLGPPPGTGRTPCRWLG